MQKLYDLSGAQDNKSYQIVQISKMLQHAPTLAIVAVHTAENELPKVYERPKNISI